MISFADVVKNNYSLDIKNPNSPVEIHDDPDNLLRDYVQASKLVQEIQVQLKSLLKKSLES